MHGSSNSQDARNKLRSDGLLVFLVVRANVLVGFDQALLLLFQ